MRSILVASQGGRVLIQGCWTVVDAVGRRTAISGRVELRRHVLADRDPQSWRRQAVFLYLQNAAVSEIWARDNLMDGIATSRRAVNRRITPFARSLKRHVPRHWNVGAETTSKVGNDRTLSWYRFHKVR